MGWITLSESEEYYSNGDYGFTKLKEGIVEALDALQNKPDFDLSEFDSNGDGIVDGFGILHSGYGAEFGGADCFGTSNVNRIWSHKGGVDWISSNNITVDRYYVSSGLRNKCGSDIVRMGIICHKLGHYLGLPDLYDATFEGSGVGAYDVMSQSWGFDGTGMYPPYLSAWSKVSVGWVTPTVIEEDGTYQIAASHDSNAAYRIDPGFPNGEYLLIEVSRMALIPNCPMAALPCGTSMRMPTKMLEDIPIKMSGQRTESIIKSLCFLLMATTIWRGA